MMDTILSIIQIILSVFLVTLILLQQKGTGLGSAFGGSSNIYTTKRGIDSVIFKTTIITSILFFGVSLMLVILS